MFYIDENKHGSEAWWNKTDHPSLDLDVVCFVSLPQASERSSNFNVSNTGGNQKRAVLAKWSDK